MSFEAVRATLESGRLPHALLFLGQAGSGRHEAARELAQALLGKPDNHPDLHWLAPEEDSRTLKIEEVRRLIAEAHLKPYQAESKLFVIDRAECLNEISQNALLKTLEEPPARSYFVLITHAAEALLPTVRSRLRTVHFRPSSAVAAEPDEKTERLKSALWEKVALEKTAKAPELAALTREQAISAIDYSIAGLRESLLMRSGCESMLPALQDRLQKQRLSESLDERALIRRIETLAEFKEKISQNANAKLALSVLWDEL